jgi:hypothetical protein
LDALTRHRLSLLGFASDAIDALAALPVGQRVRRIYRQFVRKIPYETLSSMARRRAIPAQPESWPRGTDRLLRDASESGLGGTCFSMAYALADLFRGAGANAHTTLGHHLKKEEPHAAVVVYEEDGPFLYDPSYFVPEGIPVRPGGAVEDPLFTHRLEARRGPMLTLVQAGPGRPTTSVYSLIPVPAPADAFRTAWVSTFLGRSHRPVRIARRVGDEIRWFGEEKGHLEVLTPGGTHVVDPGPDLAAGLHRAFDVREDVLRAHFAVHPSHA